MHCGALSRVAALHGCVDGLSEDEMLVAGRTRLRQAQGGSLNAVGQSAVLLMTRDLCTRCQIRRVRARTNDPHRSGMTAVDLFAADELS